MIASRDGEGLYANAAFATMVGRRETRQALQPCRSCSPASRRRAQRCSGSRAPPSVATRSVEEFALRSAGPGQRGGRKLRVSVHPFETDGEGASEPLVVWRIADVTVERMQEAARLANVEVQLAQFDSAPVGLASVSGDGSLLHVNATLARWLGRTAALGAGAAPDARRHHVG